MIVAPRMDAASSTDPVPSKRGTSPPATAAGSGGAMKTPNVKPIAMIATSPITTNSNVRGPRRDWTIEQHDRDRAGDDAAPQQRDAEQQVERDRAADHLGDVGRHRHELGLQPVGAARPRTADAVAERLGQALARDDPELGREVLDQPRHRRCRARRPRPAGSRSGRRRSCCSRRCRGRGTRRRRRAQGRSATRAAVERWRAAPRAGATDGTSTSATVFGTPKL